MRFDVVIDVGFGDSGKGKLVNYLCNSRSRTNPLVVRFSGGHQAGHRVELEDGTSHVHKSFPSGTLTGHAGFLSKHCLLYPPFVRKEYEELVGKGVKPRLAVDPFLSITTEYDIAYGRQREQEIKHGSCGSGIGATRMRELNSHIVLRAMDFHSEFMWTYKLNKIKQYYEQLGFTEDLSEWDGVAENVEWFRKHIMIEEFTNVADLVRCDNVIFEGSQGVLLDKDVGTFPHVTYANTTGKNAIELVNYICRINTIEENELHVHYVTRAYGWRHGYGPVPWKEEEAFTFDRPGDYNQDNEHQGPVRYGPLDKNLVAWATVVDAHDHLRADRDVGDKDASLNLYVSHVDHVSEEYLAKVLAPFLDECVGEFDKVMLSGTPQSKYYEYIPSEIQKELDTIVSQGSKSS